MKYRSPIMLLHHRHEIVQPTAVVVAILLINYVISILCTYVYIYIYILRLTLHLHYAYFVLVTTNAGYVFFFFFFFLLPFPLLLFFFFLFQSMNNSHKANVVRLLRAFFLITRIQAWFFSPPPLFLFS